MTGEEYDATEADGVLVKGDDGKFWLRHPPITQALRAERDGTMVDVGQQQAETEPEAQRAEIERLRARLARAEALIPRWRDRQTTCFIQGRFANGANVQTMADELAAALSDTPAT